MIKYDRSNIKKIIDETSEKVVLLGAGNISGLTFKILSDLGVTVDYLCENDERRRNISNIREVKDYQGFKDLKVISYEELKDLGKKVNIFLSNQYIKYLLPKLEEDNFQNIFFSTELLKHKNLDEIYKGGLHPLKIKRIVDYYCEMTKKMDYLKSNHLSLKTLDVQITERCSLKCKDCSNLMQYYTKPQNAEMEDLFVSLDKIMSVIDSIDEFRVLGGDPFMNKEMYKVINKLDAYNSGARIAIYTNGQIIPKGENLECLRKKNVILEISNYGNISRNHDKIVKLCEDEKISYSTFKLEKWDDCGRIMPYSNKSEKELKHLFSNCCNSDLISLLDGKLYRCPFSANGTHLGAIPKNPNDTVNLLNKDLSKDELKKEIFNLYFNKDYLTACSYCNGRDYSSKHVPVAAQTREIMKFAKVNKIN